ncbi:putative IQ motif and ankyrin repeat domain-containing protein isoform X1 [Branchiostoma floridae]|uniref:IQ motif and ankyrin repeat domain-containing protein isoform X1 n=2 Tax=Branchiostoma floridae TaxID=7739 RepID=A0A9J7KWA9_BRAFL|nr:putative IQ motif and ankyrin repeat domain-containing protein isoform X1 [Branchiostoma floridae]
MPPKKPVAAPKAPRVAARGAVGAKKTNVAAKPGPKGAPVAKKGAPPSQKGKATTPSKSGTPDKNKKKVWTKEDGAACKIQTLYRGYMAKKLLQQKKKEKEDYLELMEKLEREAFVKLVKMEQAKAEEERLRMEEERRRLREEAKRRKRLLEAAFDGDNDEIITILKEVEELDNKNNVPNDMMGRALRAKHILNMVECEDANNNTPLSEAAGGGQATTIKLLIEKGADPNTIGQFQRTPLYRAAFGGHLAAIEMLLQYGADPRLFASDGATPEQVAANDDVAQVLREWDITQTEKLVEKIEAEKQRRKEEEQKRHEEECNKLEDEVATAEKQNDAKQKQLKTAYEELEKRIFEHDECTFKGFNTDITLPAVQEAERELELLKIEAEESRQRLAQLKLKLREQRNLGEGVEEELSGIKVTVRELDDVLVRDVGNKIKDSGKWPLVIDESSQASTFLRYQDTNYMNTLNPVHMEPDRIRLAVLGAIRFGKPAVLDMLDVDMFETAAMKFDQVQSGLMEAIMTKEILQENRYMSLVKESDSKEYQPSNFLHAKSESFRLFIVTKLRYPPQELLDRTYPIRIHIPGVDSGIL